MPRIYYDEALISSNVYSYRLYASRLSTITNTYIVRETVASAGLQADFRPYQLSTI